MQLSENFEKVTWPHTHYLFIEKMGPFMQTAPQAWQELHQQDRSLNLQIKKIGAMALYKIKPQMVYRAGFVIQGPPQEIPPGFQYEVFEGGQYGKYTLIGPYTQLPEACGRAMSHFDSTGEKRRDGFYIEHYVNDPKTAPEKDLITEILIPIF